MPVFSSPGSYEHADNWNKWLGKFKGVVAHGLEIGCYEGRGTLWFLDNILTHEKATMTVLDWFKGGDEHRAYGLNTTTVRDLFDNNLADYRSKKKLRDVLHMRSDCGLHILRDRATSMGDNKFDFIYIDGSHNASDVLCDAVMAWPLLQPGGILIFDDVEWKFQGPLTEPKIAVESFLKCFQGQYQLLHQEWQVAILKL